jgi:tetratricopeptide (TPR) repeat protein
MPKMKLSQTRFAIALALLVITSSGCGVINRIRSKNQLNEAARAYREAHFDEAEQHSRRALELDPNNKTAPLFIARIVHREYRPGINTPENMAKARQAIEEYKRLLQNDPKNEEAYKAVASLLGALKEEDAQRSWIVQRANDGNADSDKRSEAYVVLASKDWHCSNEITDLPANKTTTVDPTNNRATVTYKKPKEEKDFQAARMCVTRGLEEVENAIKYDPNSESAWSYKTNLLLESSKLAEMDGKMDEKAQLDKQREAAQKRTDELAKINQEKAEQKRKEEEAKHSPTPPAG